MLEIFRLTGRYKTFTLRVMVKSVQFGLYLCEPIAMFR